jgi:hypothetical protein
MGGKLTAKSLAHDANLARQWPDFPRRLKRARIRQHLLACPLLHRRAGPHTEFRFDEGEHERSEMVNPPAPCHEGYENLRPGLATVEPNPDEVRPTGRTLGHLSYLRYEQETGFEAGGGVGQTSRLRGAGEPSAQPWDSLTGDWTVRSDAGALNGF